MSEGLKNLLEQLENSESLIEQVEAQLKIRDEYFDTIIDKVDVESKKKIIEFKRESDKIINKVKKGDNNYMKDIENLKTKFK